MKLRNRKIFLIGLVTVSASVILSGCSIFVTKKQTTKYGLTPAKASQMQLNTYYIKHGKYFYKIPKGSTNYNIAEQYTSDEPDYTRNYFYVANKNEKEIPTFYKGDSVCIKTEESVLNTIRWERFLDAGYTIGVRNITETENGRFSILFDSSHIYGKSSLGKKLGMEDAESQDNSDSDESDSSLILDSIDGKKIQGKDVWTDNGILKTMKKNQEVTINIFKGSKGLSEKCKADIRAFVSFENYSTYDYDLVLKDGYIDLKIPDWFKDGYYSVGESGVFRYISKKENETDPSAIDYTVPYLYFYNNAVLVSTDKKGHKVYGFRSQKQLNEYENKKSDTEYDDSVDAVQKNTEILHNNAASDQEYQTPTPTESVSQKQ